MLGIIKGRASSGKTYTTLELANKAVQKGEKVIIIVPEQFSFECEKQVLYRLGDSYSQNVQVLSFSRICDEVSHATGGVCSKLLKESDIHIMMKKAINNVAGDLVRFKKIAHLDGFARQMAKTVSELKTAFIFPADLINFSDSIDDPSLKPKLIDTAHIYESFDALIAEKYLDPSDKLKVLYEKLENYPFFNNKTVFIDSFDGFTGQQFKIIERIFTGAKNVYISLNMSDDKKARFGVFENIVKLENRLVETYKQLNSGEIKYIVLGAPRYDSEDLSLVEKYLYNGEITDGKIENLTVCRAESIYDEAEFTAREIRKAVRENGARYRDIVIVARNVGPYIIPLKTAMEKNGIPLFIDERTPLVETAAASMFVAAAELLCGVKTEKILKLYKSGIDYFTKEELAELQNYIYVWNIDDELWYKEWDMNPNGLSTRTSSDSNTEYINSLRLKAIKPIKDKLKYSENTAESYITAIFDLVSSIGGTNSLISIYNERKSAGDTITSDIIRQSFDAVVSVLDSIVDAYKGESITTRDFLSCFTSALRLETVGNIPSSLDEVIFGSADKIRPARPEYVFILGANYGVFPRINSETGVFSNDDRKKMIDFGLLIPDKELYESINEEYLVYTNVSSAKRKLTISYSTLVDKEKGEPSAFLDDLCKAYDIKEVKEPDSLSLDNLPETKESALSLLCRTYSVDKSTAENIYASIAKTELKDKADYLIKNSEKPDFFITPKTAQQIFGNNLLLSPSAFECFSRCRFSYFCKYVLGVKRLQKSEFDNLQRGTIAHYILEKTIIDYGKNIANLTDEQISEIVDKYINEYLNKVPGFESVRTARLDYLIMTIQRSIKPVIKQLSEEFKNTDFEPVACELSIDDKNGDIPAVNIPVNAQNNVKLNGSIDRVDRFEGYLRVVDYKTGTKEFKLPDILVGQNMQMLLYLYAVCKSEKFCADPAGILYLPSKRDTKNDDSNKRMNGLILDDSEVINAMDKTNSGRFIPTKRSSSSYIDKNGFDAIFSYLERRIKATANDLYSGIISPNPVNGKKSKACEYCDFSGVCRVDQVDVPTVPSLENHEIIEEIERWGK